jgi:hypothetical protein
MNSSQWPHDWLLVKPARWIPISDHMTDCWWSQLDEFQSVTTWLTFGEARWIPISDHMTDCILGYRPSPSGLVKQMNPNPISFRALTKWMWPHDWPTTENRSCLSKNEIVKYGLYCAGSVHQHSVKAPGNFDNITGLSETIWHQKR